MSEPASESSDRAPSFLKDRATRRWLASAGILAIGIVIGGIVVLLYMPIFDLAGSFQ